MNGICEFEFSTTIATEKSEVTKQAMSATKEKPTKANCASAVEEASPISASSRRRAPITGTTDWISPRPSASTSA